MLCSDFNAFKRYNASQIAMTIHPSLQHHALPDVFWAKFAREVCPLLK
jgi:hypothetical protein